MLEEALGSRSKVRLMRALAQRGDREATTDDLVRATGQSTGTIVPALQQLTAAGVVEARTNGRTRTYVLNAAHPLAASVRRLVDEEALAIDRLCDELARRIKEAGLRFAAWVHVERPGETGPRSFVALYAICDDPKRAESLAAAHLAPHAPYLSFHALAIPEARAALAVDSVFARATEEGRVVYADADWLR